MEADEAFDPDNFTMERLTRNSGSLNRRASAGLAQELSDQPASPGDAPSPSTPAAAVTTGPQPPAGVPAAYDPHDFAGLNVTEDVQEVFKLIGRYAPPPLEHLPLLLRPFIPDFVPALGRVDEFIKVPRPDGAPDHLGLRVLDEPAALQSDPALLTLQLRATGREGAAGARHAALGAIPHAALDRQQRLDAFISSISELHKCRPTGASSCYSRPMPDVEEVMLEWPPEVEQALKASRLPTGDLDMDTRGFARLVCALLDAPVHSDAALAESLHLLFSAYLAFKHNPYFVHAARSSGGSGSDRGGGGPSCGNECAASSASGSGTAAA